MQIDYPEVRQLAEAVAEEYPGRMNDDVFYSAPCFVGEILNRLDIQVPDKYDGTRFSRIPWARIGDHTFTMGAISFLQRIQDRTDKGSMWGEAIDS